MSLRVSLDPVWNFFKEGLKVICRWAKEIYRFDGFVLDPVERILLCDGTPVSLTPKAFKGKSEDLRSMGRRQHLEGSVRRERDRIRIREKRAQFLRARLRTCGPVCDRPARRIWTWSYLGPRGPRPVPDLLS